MLTIRGGFKTLLNVKHCHCPQICIIYILYIEYKHPFAYYFIALIHICLAHALNHSILVSCHHLGYTNTHTHLSVVSMPPNSEHIACRETSLLLLLLLRLLSSSFSIFISVALPENFVKAFLLELFGDRISFRFIYLILCAQSWNRTFLTIFVVWKSEIQLPFRSTPDDKTRRVQIHARVCCRQISRVY